MALIICVSDFWKNTTYYSITPHNTTGNNGCNRTIYNLEVLQQGDPVKKLPAPIRTKKRLIWCIDGIHFFYFNKELLHFLEYRRLLCTSLNNADVQMLKLRIVPPKKEIIDWKWNKMLSAILWEKIELEHLMSWLSTLGGAFSALGEQYSKHAQVAGKISKKQLMIGIKLGDPFLQSRCMLFYSISLIQTGRLRSAKYIIREQYKFARRYEERDSRLVKMCIGIWLKLQYEYDRRLKERQKA